jgi:hypothetical protein
MDLNDGTVDAGSKAKIIAIHDKTSHWASLSTETALPMHRGACQQRIAAL